MNANTYWKKRIESEIEANLKRDTELGDELKTLHERHLRNIEKEIDAFYNRYAENNKIDIVEAKKRADAFDVEGFKDKAKQYVKEKNFSTKANDELALYNLKMKVSRLELLQYNIDLELIALANAEEDLIDKMLVDSYLAEIKAQAGILGEFIPSPKMLNTMSRAIIATPFQGATWSQRIWQRQEALRVVVSSITKAAVLRGKNSTEFLPLLRKEFGVSAREAKRLVVTETARIQTAVQKESYKENGFDEYEYMAEPSACPICAKLDGKKFKVSDMEPGQNAAPMHPHCHCSTAPYVDKAELVKMMDEAERIKDIKEAENGHKGINKNLRIDSKVIYARDYERKFDKLEEHQEIITSIVNKSRAILKHRTGTEYEDLAFIDSITGDILTRNDYNVVRTVKPSKRMLAMLNDADEKTIIAIHNHPNSTVPSYADFQAAKERKYKYGLVIGHDGSVYKYTVDEDAKLTQVMYDLTIEKSKGILYNDNELNIIIDTFSKYGIHLEGL